MSGLRGNVGHVPSASWAQQDDFPWAGTLMGEEKNGVCVVRSGNVVLSLEEASEDEPVTGAGWRMVMRAASCCPCLPKAAEMLLNGSGGQAQSRGLCWPWEGSCAWDGGDEFLQAWGQTLPGNGAACSE